MYYYDGLGEHVAGYKELTPKGMYIGRAYTTLESDHRVAQASWTPTNCNTYFSNYLTIWRAGESTLMRGDNVGGTAQLYVSTPITTAASTRYTVTFSIAKAIPSRTASTRTWAYIAVEGMASQDISAYIDMQTLTFGTVGANVTGYGIRSADVGYSGIGWIEFVSDATDTSAELRVYHAAADLNLTVTRDLGYIFWHHVNITPGSGLTYHKHVDATPQARGADVLKRTDISDVSATEGVIYMKLLTDPHDTSSEDRTLWSLSDGTANERMELIITGGKLKLNVVDGGVSQVAMTGATTLAVDTVYETAVYYKANNFQLWLDGSQDVATDTSGTLPTWTQLNVGSDYNDATQLDAYLQEFKVYAGDFSGDMAGISAGTFKDPQSGVESDAADLRRDLDRLRTKDKTR
jgi:hypothetical protein